MSVVSDPKPSSAAPETDPRYAAPLAHSPPPAATPRGRPSRVAAFFLSLVAPGAGQYYFGRSYRGLVWLCIAALGPIAIGAITPSMARAGLLVAVLPLVLIVTPARFYAAIDAVRVAPNAQRPSLVAVAAAVAVSLSFITAGTFITRKLFLEAFNIPAGSMVPTLLIGDHVFVDKTATRFRRGRVMVFQFPEHPEQDFVKRVIAIEGDRLEMRGGHPWINGWEVPHCTVGHTSFQNGDTPTTGEIVAEFLDGEAYLTFMDENALQMGDEGRWDVKNGEAFMLGDNRENSHDSRRWFQGVGGGVPAWMARGEPFLIWLSVSDRGVDWSRLAKNVATPALPAAMTSLQPELERCLASRPPREATIPPRR